MTANFKLNDRVKVTTSNVAGVFGTISGTNQGAFTGKLDDGRYFQALPSQMQHERKRDLYAEVLGGMGDTSRKLLALLVMDGTAHTDDLAARTGCSNSQTATLLMGLVRNGFVQYRAKTQPAGFASWFLAEPYKEYLRASAQPKPKEAIKVEEYILWSPGSALPPTKTYSTIAEARSIAKIMAEKHPGQEFKVCGVVGSAQLKTERVVTEKQTLIVK